MPRKLNEMDRETFDFILKEAKEIHDNLLRAQQELIGYELTEFLCNWTDAHSSHLASLKNFSTELPKAIVSQGIARKTKTTSLIVKGKRRSEKEIESRKSRNVEK